MAVNRSSGGPSEYVRKSAKSSDQIADLKGSGPPLRGESVCRLLNALMNATLKQLNAPRPARAELTDSELYLLPETLADCARSYKEHLMLADAVFAAMMTSDDLQQMKDLVQEIDSSRSLDGVLTKTNEMVRDDDVVFSRNEQEIWLGRRANPFSPYYLSARVAFYPYFDGTPPVGQM